VGEIDFVGESGDEVVAATGEVGGDVGFGCGKGGKDQ